MNYFCVNLHNIKIKLYICREERNKVLKTKKKIMKTIILIGSLFALVSCKKEQSTFVYTYRYTTEQSEQYRKENQLKEFFVTSLTESNKILSSTEIENERVFLRESKANKNIVVKTDTLYFTAK
jgi:hypothetical protein